MIAIIEKGKIHSIYNDSEANKIFNLVPLSKIEYIASHVDIQDNVPVLDTEYIDVVRKLAYRSLVDDMTADYVTSQDAETLAAIESKKLEIKARWPK